MKKLLKQLSKQLGLAGLTGRQKAIVVYFVISLCLVGSMAKAPIWGLIVLVLNFANSVRLLKRVPMPDND
jgi:hypothetical protein